MPVISLVDIDNAAEEVKAAKERREPIIIPPFSNHIARHTFCSRLCEQDINVKVIQAVPDILRETEGDTLVGQNHEAERHVAHHAPGYGGG